MNIKNFIGKYTNHPVLFIGTGMSLRYLKNSYNWNNLLEMVCVELFGNQEKYLDIKAKCKIDGGFDWPKIATIIETEFNNKLEQDREGKFKEVNDLFYSNMANEVTLSRFKIYICLLLKDYQTREEMVDEINELIKVRKNISSIITTNYDTFIEDLFKFEPLIGNDIILSNPYGSIYKIHGCVTDPQKVIITESDYDFFKEKYDLIKAQLLSLFIHNPIIFLGYSITDENIKTLLKTLFRYVEANSETAEKIKSNFLLVERAKGSRSKTITEHDIEIEGFPLIRINKLKTDDFKSLYQAISKLHLPISTMDIRKVETVIKDIHSGGKIEVSFTDNLSNLKNKDMVIAIGSKDSITVKYQYLTPTEMMRDYFKIVKDSNKQLIEQINKYSIRENQWFTYFVFSYICDDIKNIEKHKLNQMEKIRSHAESLQSKNTVVHSSIKKIISDNKIADSYKINSIFLSFYLGEINMSEIHNYLLNFENKMSTDYRRILCVFDVHFYLNLTMYSKKTANISTKIKTVNS